MTAVAPVSWLSFERDGDHVTVKTQTCVFFVFPYRTSELRELTDVESTFHRGDFIRKNGKRQNDRAEDQAAIILSGKDQTVTIPVSPVSVDHLKKEIQTLLANPEQNSLSLFAVANWKVGLIFAIPGALLTVLYVFGVAVMIGKVLARPFRRMKSSIDPTGD